MALDVRIAQTTLENVVHDVILQALGIRLPSVASIAALRAVATQGAGIGGSGTSARGDDDLICVTTSPVQSFRWNAVSIAPDDGVTVIQPTDVTLNGRWLAWTSPLRFSTVVGAADVTLDQITSGPLKKVLVLDNDHSDEEILALLSGRSPSVIIEATSDDPEDATLANFRWQSEVTFRISVMSENFRSGRTAAQGSQVPGDTTDPGANAIDGFLQALLLGTQLNAVVDAIRNVKPGRCTNMLSKLAQRRVVRERTYTFQVTTEFPQAPNDLVVATDAMTQAHLDALDQAKDAFDLNNYLAAGIAVTVGGGLTQPISAGSAQLAAATVNYAGSGGQTFAAYTDTYRDLSPNGTLTFIAVPNYSAAPAVTTGALRIGMTSTNGIGVTNDLILAATSATYGPRYDIPV